MITFNSQFSIFNFQFSIPNSEFSIQLIMSRKEDIIGRCRASIKERIPKPSLEHLDATQYVEPLREFVHQAELAGCKVVKVRKKEDVDKVIKETYPDAKVIASALPEVKCATINPDTIENARDLNGTDVGVVEGKFGVSENGAIWIPQEVKERAVCFISENLVAVMPESEIVSNMHQAYRKVSFNDYGYGVFIAGPSKTADIAQVLVMGAQAARSMTVILVHD